QDAYATLADKLNNRIDDLECQSKSLERFLGNVKVQHKTGEMNEETYSVASENLIFGINNATLEKKDVMSALDSLTSPSETSPVSEQQLTEPVIPEQQLIESVPNNEHHEPILVHINNSE
ncbi:MAG: CdvA-like protein, partial [Candidatus Bathyarchaeota archaeon]